MIPNQLDLFEGPVVQMDKFFKCSVDNVDGSSCGMEHGHKCLHEFTVPPPDEYWEDEE